MSNMPPKQLSRKKDRLAVSSQDGNATIAANVNLETDQGLTRALEVMTANIALMMDKKLEKMPVDIKANIPQGLTEVIEFVSKAEQRILVVENASTDSEKHLLAL